MIQFGDIKVEIKRRNKGNMLGMAAIEYQGLRITHFRIMTDKSTGEVWLEMPSIKIFAKYQRCFWVLDDEDYEKFQNLVLGAYKEHLHKIKQGFIEDTIPVDEITEIPDTQ